jgi:signal transduction histidine kinase/Pyruvate/2-oxoacid:ferredoxin oxidoreductase delta subunit
VKLPESISFITTRKERCRVCYTCVRECPAKAIRVMDGQAGILGERCINCGNCVKVCSQGAKQVVSSIEDVKQLLASGKRVAACLAPSFPAEFEDVPVGRLVGMIRALGFHQVHEVAFGADLTADRYRRLLAERPGERFICTTCPAVVAYVERFHPSLVPGLAPIVSPMVALGRVLRQMDGELGIVFIGPCIAKKQEAANTAAGSVIDQVLTFVEFREMLAGAKIMPESVTPGDFDEPHGGLGMLFPVSRGILQAAGIDEDIVAGQVVTAQGRLGFVDAIKEFATGTLDARLLEILACEGCIMGGGVSVRTPLFRRRSLVSHHVRDLLERRDRGRWDAQMARFAGLDLSRAFTPNDQRVLFATDDELRDILAKMGKHTPEDELNCGACGYESCREHAVAILKGLAESEMCLPYTIDQLRKAVRELGVSNEELARAQQALVQSEKLASMGQLAAGIAHEINNPLGVVLMYAHLLLDEAAKDPQLKDDLTMIAQQADRCKRIVAGLLHFARQNEVIRRPTDVREVVDSAVKTVSIPENIQVRMVHELNEPLAELDKDQMIQALVNIISNAVAAMAGGGALTLTTCDTETYTRFKVADTGVGIPKEHLPKIFEPFFTTKEIGKGTGLGLAVTYGIIKMHSGDIQVESNADLTAGPTGTTFTITLPRLGARQETGRQPRIESHERTRSS